MSSDEDVTLYSALDRNQKRQMMARPLLINLERCQPHGFSVSLSSSSDENGNDDDNSEGKGLVPLHSSDEDNDVDSPSEKEAERQRKLQLEREIRQKLDNDKVLSQTRAIMDKVLFTKRQTTVDNLEVISLDSDSCDDSDGAGQFEAVALPSPKLAQEARVVFRVRSNGGAVDEIAILKKDTFEQLYVSFCELHGLPQTAVTMSLHEKALAPEACVGGTLLDFDNLIEAKVDFSKQVESKKKRYLRLRLVVFGRRSEVYKIDSTATIQKLHTSYCKRHDIADPDNVVMSMRNQELRLNERLDFYGLIDQDEISVKFGDSLVSHQTIALQLRFGEDDSEVHHVIPGAKVEVLLAEIAKLKASEASKISLTIDGEEMSASQTFTVSGSRSSYICALFAHG
uniref:Rad60/SUMO-like domain-containing protein n=1 Tax=Hyaloperonospora arabidopsidis (strain Emoy2) TaxID=559515 RepID=M4B281_HYAAE